MYSSFQATRSTTPEQRPLKSKRPAKHPGGTAHACQECRRRKSRCDGGNPCRNCAAKEHSCIYVAQKPRIIPSQRAIDELSTSLQQHQAILQCLFPSTDIATLQSLSRQELVELATNESSPSSRGVFSQSGSISGHSVTPLQSDASIALEQLHENPDEYDEENPDFITDDVNALSLSGKQSSYVGSSSVATALKVIAVICPGIMKHSSLIIPSPSSRGQSDRMTSHQTGMFISKEVEVTYVDAYFDHMHVMIPMINEQQFRDNYAAGCIGDVAWLALVNMVLAMGSIAKGTCLESNHAIFYNRANNLLNLESFGSGRLETVQALALMGGLYLHYCQRPNMAVAVMGAALRMAYALGLHRMQPSGSTGNRQLDQTKRQTWWTLVCLDTLGTTTLGRPSGDSFGPAITTPRPSFDEYEDCATAAKNTFLVAAVQFCEVSAQIQDRLARSSCLNLAEAAAYDTQLEQQLLSLPSQLRSPGTCPPRLIIPRAVHKWQNQNVRLLLHRPTLLAAALSRTSFGDLVAEEQNSIQRCRILAEETINDIAREFHPDAVCGWHAVWYIFQASMVPLVSVFYDYDNVDCARWHGQIETVLRSLQAMEMWSPVAKRTYEVIVELHQSSILVPKEVPTNGAQVWDAQVPFVLDETWANSMWFNASEWQTFPVEPMEYLGTNYHQGYTNDAHPYMNGVGQDYRNIGHTMRPPQ